MLKDWQYLESCRYCRAGDQNHLHGKAVRDPEGSDAMGIQLEWRSQADGHFD